MGINVDFFGDHRNLLGESPLWDARTGVLWWVDAVAQAIRCARPGAGKAREWATPDVIGSIALAEHGLMAALRDGFYAFDPDTGTFDPLALPETENQGVRFNDGKADRQGRFLGGTMYYNDQPGTPGKLYRLERDRSTTVLETGIRIANSLCFSPAGDRMYFADSLQYCIWAYPYDAETGGVGDRTILFDGTALGSAPDGATVDAEGYLWVALVQAQKLMRLSPAGAITQLIDLPIPYPACPAFGGEALDTLFVTSIGNSGHLLRTDHPDGGRMLAITGLPAPGLPEARCALETLI